MASTDNTFQLLLEEIKKMNQNLETASYAINNLTMQINSLPDTVNPIILPTTNAKQTPNACANGLHALQTPRVFGYVNWDCSHDILEEQKLVKMSFFRGLLTTMESTLNALVVASQKYDSYGRAITTGKEIQTNAINHFESLNTPANYTIINKEIRFPLDAVYLDVNSEVVKKEIDFMNKLNVQPTEGVTERFLTICENEMLTCEVFEKKYGLKWV